MEVLIGDRFHPHGQRHLEAEIAAMQKEIDIQKQKAVAAMERFERTKKWLGIIDYLIRYRLKPSPQARLKTQ